MQNLPMWALLPFLAFILFSITIPFWNKSRSPEMEEQEAALDAQPVLREALQTSHGSHDSPASAMAENETDYEEPLKKAA